MIWNESFKPLSRRLNISHGHFSKSFWPPNFAFYFTATCRRGGHTNTLEQEYFYPHLQAIRGCDLRDVSTISSRWNCDSPIGHLHVRTYEQQKVQCDLNSSGHCNSWGRVLAERIFLFWAAGFISRVLWPDFFSSFLWGKMPRTKNSSRKPPLQNPPTFTQQKSPTHFCRGAGPTIRIARLHCTTICLRFEWQRPSKRTTVNELRASFHLR